MGQSTSNVSYIFTSDSSNVNLLAFIFLLFAAYAVFRANRRVAVAALLLTALIIPLGQQFVIFGLHVRFSRLLVLLGYARIYIRRENLGYKLNRIDKLFIAWSLVSLACKIIRGPKAESFGVCFDSLGAYFMIRMLLIDPVDVVFHIRVLAIAGIGVAICMGFEEFTHHNPLSIFGGVPAVTIVREGRFRCQGPFRHPILAGTYAATMFPLLIGAWFQSKRARMLAVVCIAATFFSTITAASSGPLITLLAVFVGFFLWLFRERMGAVRWSVVALIMVFAAFMDAPVWYLIAKISDITGGTGWHRAFIIDQAVKHFDEWALVGSSFTAHWAIDPGTILWFTDPNNMDITNQYIREGLDGGLVGLLLFVFIIGNCFAAVGRSWRMNGDCGLSPRTKWSLGVCLAAHCTAFISVSYFDQIQMFWFWLLAVISGLYSCGLVFSGRQRMQGLGSRDSAKDEENGSRASA